MVMFFATYVRGRAPREFARDRGSSLYGRGGAAIERSSDDLIGLCDAW